LIVQDVFGGKLLTAPIQGQEHYWNLLEGNFEIDLTRIQFEGKAHPTRPPIEVSRDEILANPDTLRRYELLRSAVLRRLA
jgi:hypothetical protein